MINAFERPTFEFLPLQDACLMTKEFISNEIMYFRDSVGLFLILVPTYEEYLDYHRLLSNRPSYCLIIVVLLAKKNIDNLENNRVVYEAKKN